ncbi:MAG TPA: DUF1146 family protein [Haploplasma sp.]|nr:DUF1146 family protein [Haploplasma sp.]
MGEYIIYFASLILFFTLNMQIFRSLNIDKYFKPNSHFQVKAAYIIFSLALAHILASIILKFLDWILVAINTF